MYHIYLVTLDGKTILDSTIVDGVANPVKEAAIKLREANNVPSNAWVFNSYYPHVGNPWSFIHWWIGEKVISCNYKAADGPIPPVVKMLHLIGG